MLAFKSRDSLSPRAQPALIFRSRLACAHARPMTSPVWVLTWNTAIEFDPGVRYDENTVNAIVGRFHNDHASIRRYLVDGGFLARERGEYWRTGGRVDVE